MRRAASSARTAGLMDSSKLGQRSTFKICGLEDVDYVVSDGKLSERFKKYCKEADVTILKTETRPLSHSEPLQPSLSVIVT